MKVYFLGTGSAVATAQRDNTSIYVETKSWNLLIDCSGSITHKLAAVNVDFTKVKKIFISHSHPDHMYGLPSLIHSLIPYNTFPEVFVPEAISHKVKKLLEIFNLEGKTEIYGVTSKLDNCDNIELFPTKHTPHSHGVKIYSENKILIYTSDTGPIPESEEIFKYADYLIHDCYSPERFKSLIPELDSTHTSAASLGKMAEHSKVKNLIPIHFSGEHKFSMNELKQEIEKFYSGKIIIPQDLGSLTI